jgi:hypothetical protein
MCRRCMCAATCRLLLLNVASLKYDGDSLTSTRQHVLYKPHGVFCERFIQETGSSGELITLASRCEHRPTVFPLG